MEFFVAGIEPISLLLSLDYSVAYLVFAPVGPRLSMKHRLPRMNRLINLYVARLIKLYCRRATRYFYVRGIFVFA